MINPSRSNGWVNFDHTVQMPAAALIAYSDSGDGQVGLQIERLRIFMRLGAYTVDSL
jgi:hypothetical protein